jgi:hypothetical protein
MQTPCLVTQSRDWYLDGSSPSAARLPCACCCWGTGRVNVTPYGSVGRAAWNLVSRRAQEPNPRNEEKTGLSRTKEGETCRFRPISTVTWCDCPPNIIRMIESGRVRWAGHEERTQDFDGIALGTSTHGWDIIMTLCDFCEVRTEFRFYFVVEH